MRSCARNAVGRHLQSSRNAFFTSAAAIQPSRPAMQKGFVTPMRDVPDNIIRPDYSFSGRPKTSPKTIQIYSDPVVLNKIRKSAKLARKMLDYANSQVQAGRTTEEIDILTHNEIIAHGAYPSPLNYCGFPKSICSSVNDVTCHGIPDDRRLIEGDLISIDISLYLDGFHGDNCGTVVVGKTENKRALALISATQEALDSAIAACGPGKCLADIGAAIEKVAENRDFRVVREFCGHGTGAFLHMQPLVEHCHNRSKIIMEPGMLFTIEPILVEGLRRISVWEDGWTAATLDGGLAAQFEHEILITETGAEVITVPN